MTSPTEGGVVDITTAPPALALSLPSGVSGGVVGRDCVLYGWSVRNTSATNPAQIDLYDGNDTSGQLVATISLLANESTRDYAAAPGILCLRGIFASAVAGTVTGTVFVGSLP